MKTETRVKKIIEAYQNKPEVFYDEDEKKIVLDGGNYSARQDVEDYFRPITQEVQNLFTGKIITLI